MVDMTENEDKRAVIKSKLRQNFDGKIVRKDLTKKIKEGANVPVYVLEFLLGQYCSSDDPEIIEEGVENVDAFVALTGIDEENIILSLYAKSQGAGKIIAKVNEDRRARMVADFGIDSIVSAKTATADAILSYVRARKNSQKSANVETMYQLVDEKVEALEFIVKNETNYTGITLKDLKVKPNNLIACIVRKRQIIIPNGNDSIEAGDSVIVVTMEKHLEDLSDIIAQVQ